MAQQKKGEGKEKKVEAILPHYPALAKCILVDARHGSRTDLVKDLKASELFENIIEADSIDHGMGMIMAQEADALFIGPSVTPGKAADFLKRSRELAFSKDCAFIAIIEKNAANPDDYTSQGAHGVIEKPCTRMRFFDGVVRAVVKANNGGAWASIYKASLEHAGLFGDTIRQDRPKAQPAAKPPVKPPPQAPEPAAPMSEELRQTIRFAAESASEALKDVVAGIERGEFALSPDGVPTKKSKQALQQLVGQIVSGNEADSAETKEFKEYFEKALTEWFVDVRSMSQRDATEKLREALLGFKAGAGASSENQP